MRTMMISCSLILSVLILLFSSTSFIFSAAAEFPAAGLASTRPSKDGQFARWLVNKTNYGVLSTIDRFTGSPFGNIASHSDNGGGTPFYYLAINRDPTVPNILRDSRGSYTITETQLGCPADPQSPRCAKLTLSGNFIKLGNKTEQGLLAMATLFSAHPHLSGWPTTHEFDFYKLEIKSVFLVNGFQASRFVPLADYFNPGK